ncbi:MAG: serine/threonine-protein kinase [Vicinamibacterales bacterium]
MLPDGVRLGQSLGPYRILSKLGAGGMGEVYCAHDARLERDVALKVLTPETVGDAERLERFVREARALAALNHPHIVTIYSTEEAEGIPFLTMELVQGEALNALIVPGGLALSRFYALAVPLADAIAAAHAKQVTHRDLKPANIMVSADGRLKVLDFGLATINPPEGEHATQLALTLQGAVLGTVPYMSPEQVEGKPVDHRSDVFSLGVILYELLTGRRPFAGDSHASLASSILRDSPASLGRVRPDVPADLARLIGRCLEKSLADRTISADDVRRQLVTLSRPGETSGDVPAADLSVVVLPFANLSSDPENEYFSDGLTEELIADLSSVKVLRVISRTSAARFKGSTATPKEIGEALGVHYILEGSVRKAGANLRITARMIDAWTDTQLWAGKYAGTMDDVFDLQERVSKEIVQAMDVTLTPDEAKHLAARPIADPRILDCLLRARHELWTGGMDRAERLLQQGIDAMGPLPQLVAALGQVDITRLRLTGNADAVILDRAAQRARDVMPVDPVSAHRLLGMVAFERGDLQDCAVHLKLVLATNEADTDALFWLGLCYLYAGQVEAARPIGARLVAVDPLSTTSWIVEAACCWFNGEFASGMAPMDRCVELGGTGTIMLWMRGYGLALNSRPEDARSDADAILRTDIGNPYSRQLAALTMALGGDQTGARELLRPLDGRLFDHHMSFHMAESYACAGDYDWALTLLEHAIGHGFHPYDFIVRHNRFLDPLRGDPRFLPLEQDARRRWAAFVP